ncbi:unnamed protein product [Vitrella brassicaformis CCMP3155]|uniref:SUI1 domain-containing protein n=3 Tax=Vitrella brassicaformis TaxID=1169539 RepID=A0A0G4GE90_VITBC|nr:unnamed protein product [Vitrella brassicaformis CCMP3155]|eukprot:CEM27641.1 unnamed protein product [Vitrella brassicaformis CCMP3155]
MFKKPVTLSARTSLSNKEKKKLRAALKERFPSLTDVDADLLVPDGDEVQTCKVQATRIVLYFRHKDPVIVNNDGSFFPTVYGLWLVPRMLPCFLVYAPVSKFLMGGADLMLPGVLPPKRWPQFQKGELWAVRVIENQYPIAVGKTMVSNKDIYYQGMRGRGLELYHSFTDHLWELGSRSTPNASFTAAGVTGSGDPEETELGEPPEKFPALPIASKGEDEQAAGGSERGDEDVTNGGVKENEEEQEGEGEGDEGDRDNDDRCDEREEEEHEEQEEAQPSSSSAFDNSAAAAAGAEDESPVTGPPPVTLTPDQMDVYLHHCLLEVLKTSVQESQLPLDASAIYSLMLAAADRVARHKVLIEALEKTGIADEAVKAFLLAPPPLDVKRSSHKKVPKLFTHAAKAKLLTTKEQRGNQIITGINKQHPQVTAYTPAPERPKPSAAAAASSSSSSQQQQGPSSSSAGNANTTGDMVQVLEFYKPGQRVQPVFAAAGIKTGKERFFTIQECREAVNKYVSERLPAEGDKGKSVVLDAILASAAGMKGQDGTEVAKAELWKKVQNNLDDYFCVVHPGKDHAVDPVSIKKGPISKIEVSVEDRSGGRKHTTHVLHLATYHLDEQAVAEYLSRKLACSSSTYELPGKGDKGGTAVMVQGSAAKQVAELLTTEFKVPRKYIETKDKTKPKK